MVRRQRSRGIDGGRFSKPDENFSTSYRQAFSGANVERNSLPTPGINIQAQGGKCFDFRVRRYTRLFPIPAKLPADHVLCIYWRDGLQDFYFLVADGLAIYSRGRFHGEVRQDLEQMILHDVANGSRLIVEGPSALDADILSHRNLHVFDIVAIPKRLEKRVCESEVQQVLNRPLSEVMIDSEDRRLGKRLQQNAVELLS